MTVRLILGGPLSGQFVDEQSQTYVAQLTSADGATYVALYRWSNDSGAFVFQRRFATMKELNLYKMRRRSKPSRTPQVHGTIKDWG